MIHTRKGKKRMGYKAMKTCKVIEGTVVSMALLVSQSVSDVSV